MISILIFFKKQQSCKGGTRNKSNTTHNPLPSFPITIPETRYSGTSPLVGPAEKGIGDIDRMTKAIMTDKNIPSRFWDILAEHCVLINAITSPAVDEPTTDGYVPKHHTLEKNQLRRISKYHDFANTYWVASDSVMPIPFWHPPHRRLFRDDMKSSCHQTLVS